MKSNATVEVVTLPKKSLKTQWPVVLASISTLTNCLLMVYFWYKFPWVAPASEETRDSFI